MGKHLEKAIELRNDPNVCYNCAQAVICAFAEECGLTMEQATALGANFGGGHLRHCDRRSYGTGSYGY